MAITGLLFHVCGEAVVNVSANRTNGQRELYRLQTSPARRTRGRSSSPLTGHSQFPLQTWSPYRSSLHLSG